MATYGSSIQGLINRYNDELWKHPTGFLDYVKMKLGFGWVSPAFTTAGTINEGKTLDALISHAKKRAHDALQIDPTAKSINAYFFPSGAADIESYFAPIVKLIGHASGFEQRQTGFQELAQFYLKQSASQAFKLIDRALSSEGDQSKEYHRAIQDIRDGRHLYLSLNRFGESRQYLDRNALSPLANKLAYWMFLDKYYFDLAKAQNASHTPIFAHNVRFYGAKVSEQQLKEIAMNELGLSEIEVKRQKREAHRDSQTNLLGWEIRPLRKTG